jgi:RHS repeat-associated protein
MVSTIEPLKLSPKQLHPLRTRYMDPKVARFTEMDSFTGYMEDPRSLQKYLYAQDDPVMLSDPSGLDADDMSRGNAAHKIIFGYYYIDHFGQAVLFNMKGWRGGDPLRPDITNITGNGGAIGYMAEVKTINEADDPETAHQLAGYLTQANKYQMAWKNWKPDPWQPPVYLRFFWLGAVDSQWKDWFGFIVGNVEGIISYVLWQKGENVPIDVKVPVPSYEAIKQRSTEGKRAFDKWEGDEVKPWEYIIGGLVILAALQDMITRSIALGRAAEALKEGGELLLEALEL